MCQASAGMAAESRGIDNIRKKNEWFDNSYKVNSIEVLGPYPHGDRFAVYFKYDTTDKKSSKKMLMDEIALYTTKNGKIVKEEFFAKPMM